MNSSSYFTPESLGPTVASFFSTAKKSPEATGGEIGQIMVDVILNHIAAPCAAALEVFGPWKSEGR